MLRKAILAGPDPRQIGRVHGERDRASIRELAALRWRLARERLEVHDSAYLERLADAHRPILEGFDPALAAELEGIAEGAGVTFAEVLVLNHYTDLRDIRQGAWPKGAPPPRPTDGGGCSAALVATVQGAVSGQTWDMHGTAAPFVRLLEVRLAGAPTACFLTLAGCLGMAGMNEEGLGVLINNLSSSDARVGLCWPALVRRLLRERRLSDAVAVLERAPLGSGHHYLVSDGREAVSLESSGTRKAVLHRGAAARLLHTNHCLVPEMHATEAIPNGSTTWERLRHLERRIGALQADPTPGDLARAFACHEGYPRSLCLHLPEVEGPDATATCGAIVLDHAERTILAVGGCTVQGAWVQTQVGGP
jgi:isopenicillin-N N-acyltransferase-like protein